MSAKSQTERVISQLREIILSGEVAPGERLTEIHYAKRLGVSRTPLRLALAELEKEGLLEQKTSRGFRVRNFSIDHIGDAVEVRGVLEGMAARILAERGLTPETEQQLKLSVQQGKDLICNAISEQKMVDAQAWRKINQQFHECLVLASQNSALIEAIQHNNKTPFSGPAAMTLNTAPTQLETAFVQRAQADHEDVLEALTLRQAARAEALMREHAYRSRINKRKLIENMRQGRHATQNLQPSNLGIASELQAIQA